MEEIPISPVVTVKRKKLLKKTSLSLNRTKEVSVTESIADGSLEQNSSRASEMESTFVESSVHRQLGAFYFNDNVETLETVDANPLASAILLEKACAIPVPCTVPSNEFIECTNEEFLTVGELAKRAGYMCNTNYEPLQSTPVPIKSHNYSFTQMELDTQMIGIFEAADKLPGSIVQKEVEQPPSDENALLIAEQNATAVKLVERIPSQAIQSHASSTSSSRNIVQMILKDFHIEEGEDRPFEVDLSLIESESLRRRLIQLRDYIASPPKTVNRAQVCRQYGRRVKQKKEQTLARRLSYDTDDTSRDGHPMSEDDSDVSTTVRDPNDQSDNDASMDGMTLNESVLIQANLTQLSAFFSQAATSQNEATNNVRQECNPNSVSIDFEPTFYGFASPISLPSERGPSPKTVQCRFDSFDASDEECDVLLDEETGVVPVEPRIAVDQLLEDDEDLFMLAHHPEEKAQEIVVQDKQERVNEFSLKHEILHQRDLASSDKVNKPVQSNAKYYSSHEEEADDAKLEIKNIPDEVGPINNLPSRPVVKTSFNDARNVPVIVDKPFSCGFSTAAGNGIVISKKALEQAQQMFAEEEAKLRDEKEIMPLVTSFGAEFKTAGGKTIVVSEKELEKAQQKFSEEELNVTDHVSPDKSLNALPCAEGFSTASGSAIFVSKQARERAQQMFEEVEASVEKEISSKIAQETSQKLLTVQEVESVVPFKSIPDTTHPSFTGGFTTARGSLIAVSKEALEKAEKMFENLEQSTEDKESDSNFGACFSGGFNTAGGNKISVSKKAMERAQTIFAEEEAISVELDGFNTCNGIQKFVPEIALEKVKAKSHANVKDNEHATSTVALFCGEFNTAGGRKIPVSKQALEKARTMLAEVDDPVPDQNRDVTLSNRSAFTGGFSTAGTGSSIIVSKKALEWAQKVFEEEEETLVDKENVDNNVAHSRDGAAKNNRTPVSRKALENSHQVSTKQEKPKDCTDQLVSEIRNACDQEKLVLPEGWSATGVPPLAMFSRAGGASISVSETALEKAKKIWNEIDAENSPAGCSLAKAKLMDEENVQHELLDAHQRKRKLSFPNVDESIVTPTKKLRANSTSMVSIQTSTPAATNAEAKQDKAPIVTDTKPESTSTHDADEFFAQLDDHEFQELFCEKKQKQTRLLTKFDQCVDGVPHSKPKTQTGTTDWDDSFSEIIPNLPSSGGDTDVGRSVNLSLSVQQGRTESLRKQKEYVENKPEDACRPREFDFCTRKQQHSRAGLKESVGDCFPVPATVLTSTMSVTLENVLQFRFHGPDYYGVSFCESNISGIPIGSHGAEAHLIMDCRSTIGMEAMKLAFLATPGIDPRHVPSGWVENAWRWIVTKLSAYERNFSAHLLGALTPENVFHQLQYRYKREIDSAHRPALRKMLEKDDIPGRRMVLFVSNVFKVDGPTGTELELSDGWYSVRAVIDFPLAGAVRAGKIAIGTKLMIQGAELLNHKEGCSPLEVPPNVRLKIGANACRRARWSVRLGYYRCPVPFVIRCNTIHDRGGLIVLFRATIVRVYPLMFVEKSSKEGQGSVLRSERMQQRHSRRNDANQLESLHKLYNSVQEQLERERAAVSLNRNIRVTEQTTTAELEECLENGLDVSFLDIELTRSQQLVIEQFQQRRQEELQNEINRRVKMLLEKSSTRATVTSLLKVRLVDRNQPDRKFLLSIWRPTDEVRSVLQEQNHIEFGNITANGTRNNDVQLTAHKTSSYRNVSPEKLAAPSPALAHLSRRLTPIGSIDTNDFHPPFGEFDTVGVVVHVGTGEAKKFQSIYLADTAMALLCINFWHGLAEYAYEDVVRERTVLCVSNVQWRTLNRKATSGIPQSFATEYTTFTENPRQPYLRAEWERFNVQLDAIEREPFFQHCRDRIGELGMATGGSGGTPNTTPYQQQRTLSRLQHSTPLGASNSASKRRIETLASIYASPPKMSPIVIGRNPSLRRGFKTPARLEVDRLDEPNDSGLS
uniref:Tower domain-containing protein n=1 Tax=Anopheles farauti TaxID=69004 RepID=A0A182QG36_9DIPT